MNFKNFFSIFLGVVLLSALFFTLNKSILKSGEPEEVIFDDLNAASNTEEIVFNDSDFVVDDQIFSAAEDKMQDSKKILEDKSKLSVMIDGYGNKTEIRQFVNHPRLRQVLLRTSATGQRQIFVYGHNGEVKQMSEDMLSRILTASADEIANAAEIYEGRKETRGSNFLEQQPVKPVQQKPLPSSEFIVQNQPTEPQTAEQSVPEITGQNTSTEKRETIASAQKPEDE